MESSTPFEVSTLETFSGNIRGSVLAPGDDGYDEGRTVWNSLIEKEPAVIVRCAGTADVTAAVEFARENELGIAVKGGGHHIAGHAVCDDGLVIDLGPMNGVRVDPAAETVRVEGGATWGDLNHELHAFDLEIVGMPYDEVGVAGFTLGGGMGWLSRKHGLAIDNLRSVDVVTAEGDLVRASKHENMDLFWAVRGGGGNFGVVTSFEFDCHLDQLRAYDGLFLHPIDAASDVLGFYQEFMTDAPNEVTAGAGIMQVPPNSELPDHLHGDTVLMLKVAYMGDIELGKGILEPVQEFGDPVFEMVGPKPYSEFGMEAPERQRNHWKSHYFRELGDDTIQTVIEEALPLPTPLTKVYFFSLGGAINRLDRDSTAYPHRDAHHLFEMVTQWSNPDIDEETVSWAREVHSALAPYGTGGEYVNNQSDDDRDRVKAAYGTNYERLVEVKNEWDPTNLFSSNQNVEPTM